MSNIEIRRRVWRVLGFVSCVVGFICYALSTSFYDLFGQWTSFKIVLYSILSTIFCVFTLFVNKCPKFSGALLLKAQVGFLALILTSLYSFYDDRCKQHDGEDNKGRGRNILSLVSSAAFAFMSVSLSKQIQPTFDVGMSNFFLGCLIVTAIKMNIKIALGVFAFIYVLNIIVYSFWNSKIGDIVRANMARLYGIRTLADDKGNEESERGRTDEMDIWYQAFQGATPNDEHQMLIRDATSFLA
ncbi:hypothetical protein K1719_003765 [Acacia pycnantha]|nr:hypothetical protein K1719_003725 [Acacia pycnantha]KAI9125149.1 hypothetical protein K1719_003765 [Acacia pycnantha]